MRRFERIKRGDETTPFSCGESKLDRYLKHSAIENDTRGHARCVLFWDEQTLLGYYTLSMFSLSRQAFPAARRPPENIPLALIGRFATSEAHRSSTAGLGRILLLDAFDRIGEAHRSVGCYGVVVNPKESSKGFWRKVGFTDILDEDGVATSPSVMFHSALPDW